MSCVFEGCLDFFDIFMVSWVFLFGNVELFNDFLFLDIFLVGGGVEFVDNEMVVCLIVGIIYGYD